MSYGLGNELDMLETALEASGLAWWWMELPSGTIFFSPNKTRMIERQKQDFFHYTHFTELVHDDDKDQMMQDMMDHIAGKASTYETTYRIRVSDGSYRQFYDKGRIVARRGNDVTVAGIVFDVTDVDFGRIAARIKRD